MNRFRTSRAVVVAVLALALSACLDGAARATGPRGDTDLMVASSLAVADARARLAGAVSDAGSRARLVTALRSLHGAQTAGRETESRRWLATARAELVQASRSGWLADEDRDAIGLALDTADDGLAPITFR